MRPQLFGVSALEDTEPNNHYDFTSQVSLQYMYVIYGPNDGTPSQSN